MSNENQAARESLESKLNGLLSLSDSVRRQAVYVRNRISGATPDDEQTAPKPSVTTFHDLADDIAENLRAADYILANVGNDVGSQAKAPSSGQSSGQSIATAPRSY